MSDNESSCGEYHLSVNCVVEPDKIYFLDSEIDEQIWSDYSYQKCMELFSKSSLQMLIVYPNCNVDDFYDLDIHILELRGTFKYFDFFMFNKVEYLYINHYDAPLLKLNYLNDLQCLSVSCTGELWFDNLVDIYNLRLINTNVCEIPSTLINLNELDFETTLNDICLDMTPFVDLDSIHVRGAKLTNFKHCAKLSNLSVDKFTDIAEIIDYIGQFRGKCSKYMYVFVPDYQDEFKKILDTLPDVQYKQSEYDPQKICITISPNISDIIVN